MANKKRKAQSVDDHVSEIKDLVSEVSKVIDNHPEFQDKNFGLFYQHGRLGYIDLDRFAESTKAKVNVDGEEKTLAEIKKDIDRNEK